MTIEEIRDLYRAGQPSGPIGRALASAVALMEAAGVPYCLGGTLVLGAYASPMATDDVDFHLLGEDDLERVKGLAEAHGFRPIRPHTLEHRDTGVEVDLVTPEWVKETRAMYEAAMSSAQRRALVGRSVPIPSLAGFIAIKLRAGRTKDQAHVVNALMSHPDVDLDSVSGFLEPGHLEMLDRLRDEARRELDKRDR